MPLNWLAAAVTPLLRRPEPGLAQAVEELFAAVVDHYADTDRTERALAAFHQALRPALNAPAPVVPDGLCAESGAAAHGGSSPHRGSRGPAPRDADAARLPAPTAGRGRTPRPQARPGLVSPE